MTAPELTTAWVPVPLRWRHVIAGDVIVGRDGTPWLIVTRGCDGSVGAMHTDDDRHTSAVDPDATVQVLVPATERECVELTREQLGARLIERRTA